MSTELCFTFLFSFFFLFLARKVAKKISLVDTPSSRKQHNGLVPLVGGISVYAGVFFSFCITHYNFPHAHLYLLCSGILVLLGVFDDWFDISVKVRAILQVFVAILMMFGGKLYFLNLGFVFGPHEFIIGNFGYILTLFAVLASINAFNMVDGIDGLLGGLSVIAFSIIGIFLYLDAQYGLAMWCFIVIVSSLPYIFLNLNFFGSRYKVFMGDAGSTMIGFTIIWILLETTQGFKKHITPATTLWFIAVPLMDMMVIMYRRVRKGISPFSPDREHIHHLIMRAGFSSREALFFIIFSELILSGIGLFGKYFIFTPDWMMLLLFFFVLLFYGYCLKHVFCVVRFFHYVKRYIYKR